MQTPPHRYYWGLDRKLRLSLVAFPGSSAVSKRADTPPRHASSARELHSSELTPQAALLQPHVPGWRSLRPAAPAPPLPPAHVCTMTCSPR